MPSDLRHTHLGPLESGAASWQKEQEDAVMRRFGGLFH
jgi:hypothetical protein